MKYSFLWLLIALLSFGVVSCKKDANDGYKKIIDPNDTIPEQPVDTTTVLLPCNGDTLLCGKRYDELVYIMTHNSHAHSPLFSQFAANQDQTVTKQLQDGVRALNFKTYYTNDTSCGPQGVYVYHGFPSLGCVLFSSVLQEVKDFLVANPRDILTIHIEGSATVAQMNDVFVSLGLTGYFHQQTLGQPWPTLGEMITSGKRMVLFTDRNNNSDVPGFHHSWSFMVDNNYDAKSLSEFDCNWFRGDPNGGLYLFNHFITKLSPQRDSAAVINTYDKLMGRINECQAYHGRRPTFIHLDFYELGDAKRVVDELNGVQ
ncbi:hypothetical protein BH09BAC1_BH09BAC1_05810 [soil metagenome]